MFAMPRITATTRSIPLSATLGYEELALYHETLPLFMRDWELLPHEYDALIANLSQTRTRRLSTKQHRRLSALMTILFSVSPRPIHIDGASVAVLRHPRTAPDGGQPAVDVMCTSLEGLEDVAAYFQSLPHGPWLLPGVLHDFLAQWHPRIQWYRELLEEAELMCTCVRASDADRTLARVLATKLREEALLAPRHIRDGLLRDALNSPHPSVCAWGARSLAARNAGGASHHQICTRDVRDVRDAGDAGDA
jgi:hypothetical protein